MFIRNLDNISALSLQRPPCIIRSTFAPPDPSSIAHLEHLDFQHCHSSFCSVSYFLLLFTMQSQMQILPPTQLTMPLMKFSAATTSHGYSGPIPWTHIISENGLFAMFEFSSSQNMSQATESARFKVVNDPEVLARCCAHIFRTSTNHGRRISTLMHSATKLGEQLRRLQLED